LSKGKTYQLNTFRIHAKKVLHSDLKPTEEIYLQDLIVFSQLISQFYEINIPYGLQGVLPVYEKYIPNVIQGKYTRINVQVIDWDQDFICAIDSENESNDTDYFNCDISDFPIL